MEVCFLSLSLLNSVSKLYPGMFRAASQIWLLHLVSVNKIKSDFKSTATASLLLSGGPAGGLSLLSFGKSLLPFPANHQPLEVFFFVFWHHQVSVSAINYNTDSFYGHLFRRETVRERKAAFSQYMSQILGRWQPNIHFNKYRYAASSYLAVCVSAKRKERKKRKIVALP
jgi:hypothetical protein